MGCRTGVAPFGRRVLVVRVDDSTMAKIEAGPGGALANGHGARYFDGSLGVPLAPEVKARRRRFMVWFSRCECDYQTPVGIVPDCGTLPGSWA
jgi:hypothetical protein